MRHVYKTLRAWVISKEQWCRWMEQVVKCVITFHVTVFFDVTPEFLIEMRRHRGKKIRQKQRKRHTERWQGSEREKWSWDPNDGNKYWEKFLERFITFCIQFHQVGIANRWNWVGLWHSDERAMNTIVSMAYFDGASRFACVSFFFFN